MLRLFRHRRRYLLVGLLCAAAAAATIPFVVMASSKGEINLATVPAGRLAQEGMSLLAPTSGSQLSAAAATDAAVALFPGANVEESVLATVQDPYVPSIDGRTLWIVSLSVPGGFYPPSAGPARPNATSSPASYLLIF